jgi:large subunit ribosomal protein LP0
LLYHSNISAKQIHDCRKELRTINSVVLMGKNTLIKAALQKRLSEPQEEDEDYEERSKTWTALPKMEPLLKLLKGNLGIIFTNTDLTEVKEILDRHSREAPAKVGQPAQCDVTIKAGPTGLDPKQTGFFQSLQIPTKIVKTQIDIVSDKLIIEEGQKVESNEAALLQKLNINPFSYKLQVVHVFDDGNVYGPGVLNITPESILNTYKRVLGNVAAISLEAGLPTAASAPHSMMRAFKNLLSVTFETDYTFKQAEDLKAAAEAAPKEEEKKEEVKEDDDDDEGEKEKEEDEVVAANIFGQEDDYY